MAHVVHLDIDDGTKFLFGLAALLGLVALFQGRITKLILPGGTIELDAIKRGVDAAVANTKRLGERQEELAAPKMNAPMPRPEERVSTAAAPVDPQDLNKGRFGGSSTSNGLILAADVSESDIRSGWFRIDLRVEPKAPRVLDHPVEFYLHESFDQADRIQVVQPAAGVARLTVLAWGAFTVGAVTDGGKTRLELDLSHDPRHPAPFRKR
jgi:hypothetical protein